MQDQFSRTRLLLGQAALDKLSASRVAVFGVGGVGGYVVEVLARSGVGTIDVVDDDCVCPSNINRQIIATHSTVGRPKVDVAEERIRDINPDCQVNKHRVFYLPDRGDRFDFAAYDYVVDCIDTVTAKIDIVRRCKALGVPVISCLGAAYKLDATQFRVTDLYQTMNDPLAKILRKKLRKEGILSLKVVYSPEVPLESLEPAESQCPSGADDLDSQVTEARSRRSVPASNAWVPPVEGLVCGGEVVKDLIADVIRKY